MIFPVAGVGMDAIKHAPVKSLGVKFGSKLWPAMELFYFWKFLHHWKFKKDSSKGVPAAA